MLSLLIWLTSGVGGRLANFDCGSGELSIFWCEVTSLDFLLLSVIICYSRICSIFISIIRSLNPEADVIDFL